MTDPSPTNGAPAGQARMDQTSGPARLSPETPETPPQSPAGIAEAPDAAPRGWVHRLSAVLFIVFCFELGLFLLIYPWTDSWNQNYFSWLPAGPLHSLWRPLWTNSWFRGAISGLGAANVWIALTEVFRLFSFRRRGE